MTNNSINGHLDAIGLPWRSSRALLAERYGIRKHPAYQWDVIEIETPRPFAAGLMWPVSAQVWPQFSTSVPATDFSGHVYFTNDSRENLRRTVEHLAPSLGVGMATGTSNTVGHEWRVGPASVVLHAWPRDMQRLPANNPSHEREPRLQAACFILIKTGFRPIANALERQLIGSFVPIVPIPGIAGPAGSPRCRPAEQSELEFVRLAEEAFGNCHGLIGRSDDKSALIFFERDLFVVPIADVVRLEVMRTLPAKGPGGSYLLVECRVGGSDRGVKSLRVCSGERADDLTEVAALIANAIGKPLVVHPYDHDC